MQYAYKSLTGCSRRLLQKTMPGRITDKGIDKYTENRRQLRVSLIMSKHTAFVKKGEYQIFTT